MSLVRVVFFCAIFAAIAAYIFPLISYNPSAGAADLSMILFVLLGIGAIVLRIVAMRRR